MNKPLSQDELGENLCDYCPYTDFGSTPVGTGPWNLCEGICCDEAYENYLEQFEN